MNARTGSPEIRIEEPRTPATSPTSPICPQCGRPLPGDAVQGLCPACLLGAALNAVDRKSGVDQPVAGSLIGRYRLLDKIGEGGFGVVWKAEQLEPIQRIVALKIIRSGMDTGEVIARFEAERQTLALMNHPNIAQVLDAGTTASDHPYFVMELVEGIPITQFCDRHHLSTAERIRLFVTVCDAVQHAHQKGVIHRDLKPSNILVAAREGEATKGVPKIIDFGIAKATTASFTGETFFTRLHAFIGTPAYASPEQIDENGLDVDTRTDVYSLGVLLYMLLVGQPPFDPDTLQRAGLQAMCRMIREVDPPRPSRRFATLTDADRANVAALRGSEAMKLGQQLRGDLDWVVVRCLEKDRTRRFESASALARDLQHFLADEPVTARPPSANYVLGKFVRRHRIGVAATSAVVFALVAGLGLAIAGYQRAVAQRQATETARAQAQQMITFIMDDLQPSLQAYGRVDAMTGSAEMAVRYFENLPPELRGDDTIRAHATALEVLFAARSGTRGNFLRKESVPAWEAMAKALNLRQKLAAAHPDDPDAATAVLEDDYLVTTHSLPASEEDARSRDFVRKYRELEQRFPDNPAVRRGLTEALRNRGLRAGREFGQPEEGLALASEAAARLQQILEQTPDDPAARIEYAIGLGSWSHAARYAGNLTDALRLGEDAAAVARSALAADPTNHHVLAYTAIVTQFLVYTHADLGDGRTLEATKTARGYFQNLITLDPANTEWRTTDAQLCIMEGHALTERHRLAEARAAFEEAAASLAAGPSSQTTDEFLMGTVASAGVTAAMTGNGAEATVHLTALRDRFSSVPLASPDGSLERVRARFHWLYEQSRVLEAMRAWEELERVARAMVEETDAGIRRFPGSDFELFRRRATAHACLGRALLRQGQPAAAVPLLHLAASGFRDAPLGGTFSDLPKSRITETDEDLAEALTLTRQTEEARTLLAAALAQRESAMDRQGPTAHAEARFELARTSYLLARTFDPAELPLAERRQALLDRAAGLLDGLRAEGDPFIGVPELHAAVVAARGVHTD